MLIGGMTVTRGLPTHPRREIPTLKNEVIQVGALNVLLLWPLIYTHIIHVQKLRKHGRFIGITREPATHGKIHDDKKLMVENPLIRDIGWREFEEFLIVEKP